MFAVEGAADGRWAVVDPDDLVEQALGAEDLIQQQAGIGVGVPVQVQVERAGWRQQAVHQRQARVEHIQVGIQVRPVIGVALGQLPFLRLARVFAAPDTCRVAPVGEKRRVGVDQVDAPFVFGQQGRHHCQVIPQDQPVCGELRLEVACALGIDQAVGAAAQPGRRKRQRFCRPRSGEA